MGRLKGGYYTLDIYPKIIEELELESGTTKSVSRATDNPFIKALNELVDEETLCFKTDKPLLIKYDNGEGNFGCIFNENGGGIIAITDGDESIYEISVVSDSTFNIFYNVV